MNNIKRKILGIIICMMLIIVIPAVGIPSNMETEKEMIVNDYSVSVYRTEISGVDFVLSVNGFSTEFIDVDGRSFERLSLASNGRTAEYGKAELPVVSFYVAVPQGAEVDLNYDTLGYTLLQDYNIYPSQPPKPETDGYIDPPFTINETFYSSDEYYPSSVVDVSPIMVMRGCRIVMISVFPFIYNPATKELKIYNNIDISINFIGGTGEFIPERYRSIYFQPLFDAFLLNANSVKRATLNNPRVGMSSDIRADLLIVVYDEFYEEILPLAEWRHSIGIETKVVKWSEIGTTSEDLRMYVNNSYYTWEIPPSFLLIVGDADHVPVNYIYNHPYPYPPSKTGTDHWYVAFEGTDYLPEIHEGRISVDDESELITVVEKILNYSIAPYMEEDWFNNVLLASKEESGRYFIWGSETIYDYLSPLGYNVTRQYSGGSPPGSTQGVIDAINNGVIIANHRDHGGETGWSAPKFTTSNVLNDLDNGAKYPVMFSINCLSGYFDKETSGGGPECLAEVALRVGFVAVIAASRVSYSGYNDELCRGFYDGMFSDFDPDYPTDSSATPYSTEVFMMSQVLNYGKFWMYDKYIIPGGCPPYPWDPDHEVSRAEFEMFHVHGDPTMQIRTAFPQNPTVDHPERTPMIPHILQVAVSINNTPVEGALVLVTQGDDLYIRNLTDASGNAYLDIDPPTNDELTVIVTGNNCLRYTGSIIVNVLPEIPCRPSGETRGETGREYLYTTSTTDLDGEHIFYNFSWGDGTYSGWVGPFDSGAVASATHAWNEGWRTYEIKVKAMDTCDEESDWSEPLEVSMPKNTVRYAPFLEFLHHYFPWIHSIIQHIL